MALSAVDNAATPSAAWVSTKEAERLTGRHRKTLGRLVDQGRLRRRKNPEDGQWEYERHRLVALGEPQDDPADDLLDAARQVIATIGNQVGIMGEPMRLYVEHLERELKRLTEANDQLQRLQVEMIAAREEAHNQAFEREAAAAELEGRESRKTMALAQASNWLDSLVSEARASKLLGTITNEQLDQLLAVGGAFLNAEQLGMLRAVREQRTKQTIDAEGAESVAG